jgi:hypothetical protein
MKVKQLAAASPQAANSPQAHEQASQAAGFDWTSARRLPDSKSTSQLTVKFALAYFSEWNTYAYYRKPLGDALGLLIVSSAACVSCLLACLFCYSRPRRNEAGLVVYTFLCRHYPHDDRSRQDERGKS